MRRESELTAKLAAMERTLGAYRKAKQENDERFMLERDEARAQVEKMREALALLPITLAGLETPFHQKLSAHDAYQFAWATCVMNLKLRIDAILAAPPAVGTED